MTPEYLKSILNYDPETGVFTWLHDHRGPVRAGDVAGRTKPNGYISVKIAQQEFYAHRLAYLYMTGTFPEHEVDHINRNRADNRWVNLRSASAANNKANTPVRRTSAVGLKGVSLHKKSGKWRARIQTDTIGYYETPEFAHAAYVKEAAKRFGEFASK